MAQARIGICLIATLIIPLAGCSSAAKAPKAWSVETALKSPVSGQWEGTWYNTGAESQGQPLRCLAVQSADDRWTATFDAVCGREASFTFPMEGRMVDGKVVFSGRVDLGPENGGVYDWDGVVAGTEFTGKFHNAHYDGGFHMTKSPETALSAASCPTDLPVVVAQSAI